MQSDDAFFILGIKKTSSYKEIEEAYKQLSSELDRQRKTSNSVQEINKADRRLSEVNEAYNSLIKEKYKNLNFSDDNDKAIHFPRRFLIYNVLLIILAILILLSAMFFIKIALIIFFILFGILFVVTLSDLCITCLINYYNR